MDTGEFFKSELQQNSWCTLSCNNAHNKIHDFWELNSLEAAMTENERLQVWQRCTAHDWYQCPSYTYIRETKMSTLRKNMFATTCLSALLDHQLWILTWLPTLLHTASWCTSNVNRIHAQSYLNESCKIFCRLWQAACKESVCGYKQSLSCQADCEQLLWWCDFNLCMNHLYTPSNM